MSGVKDVVYGSRLYQLSLRGRFPHGLAFYPENLWPGDVERANDLFRGRFHLAGETVEVGQNPPWFGAEGSDEWRAELQGFRWLRHFQAAGGESATRAARSLAGSWLTHHPGYDPFIWRADILARRLISWCLHADILFKNAELTYRSDLLRSLARQARHLARVAENAPSGVSAVTAATGLAFVGLCLPESRSWTEKGLVLLTDQINRQLRSDGGHVSRSPHAQHQVLQDLILLKRTMMNIGEPPPEPLVNAIDRMTPTLRMMRHGDGGLGLFNGGTEGVAEDIEQTIRRSGIRGKPNLSAPKAGFERLQGGHTALIADFGGPAPEPGVGFAGLLSFEMSHRRERVIVNSGASRPPSQQWERALASTAAHSTLTIADTNAVGVPDAGRRRKRRLEAEALRTESADATWLDMMHTGYQERFGVVHRRRLYLDRDGRDLRGEDRLEVADRRKLNVVPFAVRFHLHPSASAVMAQGGDAALIRLKSGRGWRFRVAGGTLKLEESVYLGDGAPRRSQQIVASGDLDSSDVTVQWALTLIDGADA